jgi:AraC-like DNA-binding protein
LAFFDFLLNFDLKGAVGKTVSTGIGEWDFERVGQELYRLRKCNSTQRKYRITAVTGPRWLLGRVELSGGSYRFLRDGELVAPSGKTWGVYYPPHSLCVAELDHPLTRSEALWGPGPAPPGLPAEPILFTAPAGPFPSSAKEAVRFVLAGGSPVNIERCSAPSRLSFLLKRAIDRSGARTQISDLTDGLGISHPQATRAFKTDFGLTPVAYRSALRVEEGILRLLEGRSALDACFDAGFSDLSRFNRAMKTITTVSPSKFLGARLND